MSEKQSKIAKKYENFMKKHYYLCAITKTPMLLVFLTIAVLFGFKALSMPSEVNRYAVVTAVGIDLSDDEDKMYEVSALVFVPIAEQGFSESYKMISSEGRSVSEAMDFIGLHLGRETGLSHIKFIVLNEDLLMDDVSKFLDYLTRNIHLSSSTKLITTDVSAKDFISAAQNLDSESSIKVSEIITYNRRYIYATDSSLETFFKGTFGPTKVGLMSKLTVKPGEGEGLSAAQTDGQTASQGGGAGGAGPKTEIVNDGETVVFKEGVSKLTLTGEQLKKVNFVRGNYKSGSIEIDHVTDKDLNDARVVFEVFGKKLNFKVKYENNVPVIYIDTSLTLRISEVENSGKSPQQNVELFVITPKTTDMIEMKVKRSMSEGLEIMRDNQLDMGDFYTMLSNNNRKEFKKFLETLEDPEDYLNHIVFKVSVKVYSK